MSGWLLFSIYVAGVVLIVVIDALYDLDLDDGVGPIAAGWPLFALLAVPLIPVALLVLLHHKLRHGTWTP